MRSLFTSYVLLVAASLVAAGCINNVNGHGAAEPQVRGLASSDLDCPDSEIRLTEELGGRYKAVGCGRKTYYRTACDGLSCTVTGENGPFIPWRDRPDPNDPVPSRTGYP
jgi:hypothetical protein